MCYHKLTQTGKVIFRSTLQKVTNTELSTDELKESFMEFDAEIHLRLNADNYGYVISKLSPQYWAHILEEYPNFSEEFKRIFSNDDIL